MLQQFRGLNGIEPIGGVVLDASGNVYGTTNLGGQSGLGTVFKLTPSTSSRGTTWAQTILHSFAPAPPEGSTGDDVDGEEPTAAPVLDAKGNLFGTTKYGGRTGGGTVFMLTAPAKGETRWKERVIQSFDYRHRNSYGVIFNSSGELYGTTVDDESYVYSGTVYRLTPPLPGRSEWQITTLFVFPLATSGAGGGYPASGVVFDQAGNLYGEVSYGGDQGAGGVFELSPTAGGDANWTETLIYSFPQYGGGSGGLTFDPSGNLYGTAGDPGLIFRLSPPKQAGQSWIYTDLYNFGSGGFSDGTYPQSGVVISSVGIIYGTTPYGGVLGNGTVFELDPPASGQTVWTEKTLSNFSKSNGDGGRLPTAGVTIDSEARLVGTASLGGKGACFNGTIQGCGTVFQLKQPH